MKARENPFSTDRVLLRVRYRPPDETSWDSLLERLAGLRYRAAIVGPDGSGKTTLLEDLAPRLEMRGFLTRPVFVNDTSPLPAAGDPRGLFGDVSGKDIILLDGADLIGRSAWRRFLGGAEAAGGLIVTSHRPGLLPTLLATRTTPELFARIVGELIGEPERELADRLPDLFHRHDGNIREALSALYDEWAERVGTDGVGGRRTAPIVFAAARPETRQQFSFCPPKSGADGAAPSRTR